MRAVPKRRTIPMLCINDLFCFFFFNAADCREVLLAGNKTSGVHTISPLNNEYEFDVFCDQETQGGGWTIIQQRNDGSLSFFRTWDEYKNGFGTVGSQSEMWLGNDKIHSLTTENTELLIQLEAFDGSKGFAMYSDFHVAGENDHYRLSLGDFSGNLPNKLGTHSNAIFSVGTCADVQGVGWWFTSSCGGVLLNSQYGQNTGNMTWDDFPNSGDAGGKLMTTSMKIRRTEGEGLLEVPFLYNSTFLAKVTVTTERSRVCCCRIMLGDYLNPAKQQPAERSDACYLK